VLTKAALLHIDYLEAYTRQMPQPVRDYVDRHMNCEDVAMQFLVANVSGRPPLFVRSSLGDLGVVGGISTRGGHMAPSLRQPPRPTTPLPLDPPPRITAVSS